MANDGKIYITISDTRGGKGVGVSNDADKKSDKKENTASKYIRHRFFNIIESEAKTIVGYTIGNIGNFTGNYQMQRDIESAISIVSFVADIGVAAYVGAKSGGPIGMAIAVAGQVVSKGVQTGLEIKSDMLENRRINRNIDIMRERLGLEGLTNGGRTGGY